MYIENSAIPVFIGIKRFELINNLDALKIRKGWRPKTVRRLKPDGKKYCVNYLKGVSFAVPL